MSEIMKYIYIYDNLVSPQPEIGKLRSKFKNSPLERQVKNGTNLNWANSRQEQLGYILDQPVS